MYRAGHPVIMEYEKRLTRALSFAEEHRPRSSGASFGFEDMPPSRYPPRVATNHELLWWHLARGELRPRESCVVNLPFAPRMPLPDFPLE